MNLSNSYALSHPTLIPFQIRFESSLKEPIVQKCYTLSQLIHESLSTNIKEIQINYVSLIEDIFSFGSHSMSSEWGLKLISRNFNPREFDSIFAFLHINGSLFQLIRQLMTDPLNRYEFAKSCLPMPTKLSLEEGIIPSFYANKISHGFANTISLNALEFYVFHFAYYMLNNTSNMYCQQNPYFLEQLNNANADPSNIVYYAILESYLSYFVPKSNYETVSHPNQSPQSSIWQSLSSTTSSLLNLGTASNAVSQKQMSSPQTSTLFKSSILNRKHVLSAEYQSESSEQSFQRIPHDSLGTEVAKCETFLLIVTEIWLNHAIPHSHNKKQLSPSKQIFFTPNCDHMRAVRILIKHLHYFANSYSKRMNDTINIVDSSPLDDVKRSIWSPKYLLQKKLYTFLRLSFDHWPNDTSFRLPLETWLSYVQPWRYTNISEMATNHLDGDEREVVSTNILSDNPSNMIDIRWKTFISDNLLFYTVIFRQLIPRFSRLLDLSASKNALMLFRITKVFSQQNLSLWIKEAENSLLNSETSILQNSWISNTRASLLSPTIRQSNVGMISGNLRHHLMELESNSFEYIPLFCHSIKPLIIQLLNEISKALINVNEILISATCKSEMTSTSGPYILRFIKSLFELYDDLSQSDDHKKVLMEKNKTKNHLQISSSQLSQLFEVPEPQTVITNDDELIDSIDENTSPQLRQRMRDSNPLSYQGSYRRSLTYEDQNGTPKLTSLGRYQVLNKLRKPEFNSLEGNPDEQPVRTYEIYFLVRLLLFISVWINTRYGQHIQRLYNREGFIGLLFRQLISGPTSYIKLVKNGAYRPPERLTEVLPPRINIRFLANKSYLLCTFIVITIVYLFNYSLISFSFLAFVMFFTYLLTKTLLIYLSSANAIN